MKLQTETNLRISAGLLVYGDLEGDGVCDTHLPGQTVFIWNKTKVRELNTSH